jgi:hypothetical protein
VVGVCEAEGRGEQTKLGPLERTLLAVTRYERCPIYSVDLLKNSSQTRDTKNATRMKRFYRG